MNTRTVSCFAAAAVAIAANAVEFTAPKGVSVPKNDLATRAKLIAPVKEGEFRLRPTFNAVGACFGAKEAVPGLVFEYRRTGGEWKRARSFPYFEETRDYRGSAWDLDEDAAYEARLVAGEKTVASAGFRTWKSAVPVAKTVVIDPKTAVFPIRVADRGTETGWIRYTVPAGSVLENPTAELTFDVKDAEYVLIEGIRFQGGRGRHAVDMNGAKCVRIVNCEFSHWGRFGETRFDKLGRKHVPGGDSGYGINFDGAVNVGPGCVGTVIERCWAHDPNLSANSWFYSHPAGGEAVMLCKPEHSTVIRWCDFTGSDCHRFNDAVESLGNFHEDGGYNRDGDCQGNFMIFCNDDCIELDGGQQNVRCWGNRFESALCGVSIQGCMASPVYVADNLFAGMCEEFGSAGQTVKTGGGNHGWEAHAYIDGNLLWGPGSGITMMELLQCEIRGNVFCGRQGIGSRDRTTKSVYEDNRMEAEIPEADLPTDLPRRPLGFVLDRARFSGIRLEKGVLSQPELKVTAKSTGAADIPFAIAINDDTPWLKVSPRSGTVPAGGRVELTVSFDVAKMKDRHDYRGAFLVRTPEGLSRPVSVYVETDFVPPARPTLRQGAFAAYAGLAEPVVLAAGKNAAVHEYAFDVPKDGRYYFMVRVKEWGRLQGAIDDDPFEPVKPCWKPYWQWLMFAPGRDFGNRIRYYDLKAGRHVLRVRGEKGAMKLEDVLVTDDPLPFEPK